MNKKYKWPKSQMMQVMNQKVILVSKNKTKQKKQNQKKKQTNKTQVPVLGGFGR